MELIKYYLLTKGRGILIFISQLVGGITAAAIIDALTPGPLLVANSLGRKFSNIRVQPFWCWRCPKANVSTSQGLFMEMFLTAELVLAIFMVNFNLSWSICLLANIHASLLSKRLILISMKIRKQIFYLLNSIAPSDLPCTAWDRDSIIHGPYGWHILHRRRLKSSKIARSCRSRKDIPWLFLDILCVKVSNNLLTII